MANLYCQNYVTCNGMFVDRGDLATNESVARAKGWHIYHGTTIGGVPHEGLLCPQCIGMHRRRLNPAPPLLPGQQELISIEVIIDPTAGPLAMDL
jgi:hypothetical protein